MYEITIDDRFTRTRLHELDVLAILAEEFPQPDLRTPDQANNGIRNHLGYLGKGILNYLGFD